MSKELINKAITTCFAKIARVDGSIGSDEIDIMNSSEWCDEKYSVQAEVT